jgi:hypothetical protein
MNNDFFYNYKNEAFFEDGTIKKILILLVAGGIIGVLLAVMFAGFLYGIQPKIDEGQLSYGKLFIIIIAPCILLGLITGILLL